MTRPAGQTDTTLLIAGTALLSIGGYAIYLITRRESAPDKKRIRVEKHITVARPPAELYNFWRKLETSPQVMRHLESVNVSGDKRSHWVAKAPAGQTVSWDAETVSDRKNELLAWRSLEGADVQNAGSVSFRELSHGRGTELAVALTYEPPFGKVGAALTQLMGEEPAAQLQDDLRRFKQRMETGEIATIEGQTSGRA